MPNRIIREGIVSSEKVNLLSWPAEVFYRRLLSIVDDFGRYSANVKLLRAACFPLKLDVVSDGDVGKWLGENRKAALVNVYRVSGKDYLEIVNFGQQVRALKSKYPPPPSSDSKCEQMISDAHLDVVGVGDGIEDVDEGDRGRTARKNGSPVLPDWLPQDAWQAWLEVRSRNKAPNTQRALGLAVRELERLKAKGQDPRAVLEQSTLRGWRGLFEVKTGGAIPDYAAAAQNFKD